MCAHCYWIGHYSRTFPWTELGHSIKFFLKDQTPHEFILICPIQVQDYFGICAFSSRSPLCLLSFTLRILVLKDMKMMTKLEYLHFFSFSHNYTHATASDYQHWFYPHQHDYQKKSNCMLHSLFLHSCHIWSKMLEDMSGARMTCYNSVGAGKGHCWDVVGRGWGCWYSPHA